jgi:hypothetical protein
MLGLGAALAATLIAAAVLAGSGSALSASPNQFSSYPIATFTPAEETTHNNAGDSVCGTFQPSEPTSENMGDLNAKKGSFLARVSLSDGAVIRRLGLFANDNDADNGAYVFLVRKLLMTGLSPQFNGYHVLAQTHSTGAVLNTMRHFVDKTVSLGTVDNARFEYFLEVVNCATVEPFAAQLVFTK